MPRFSLLQQVPGTIEHVEGRLAAHGLAIPPRNFTTNALCVLGPDAGRAWLTAVVEQLDAMKRRNDKNLARAVEWLPRNRRGFRFDVDRAEGLIRAAGEARRRGDDHPGWPLLATWAAECVPHTCDELSLCRVCKARKERCR